MATSLRYSHTFFSRSSNLTIIKVYAVDIYRKTILVTLFGNKMESFLKDVLDLKTPKLLIDVKVENDKNGKQLTAIASTKIVYAI